MGVRLYRFNNKKTWNDVFDEVTDPEEVDLKKMDQILVTVSDRAGQILLDTIGFTLLSILTTTDEDSVK
jgi:hypothetical protein